MEVETVKQEDIEESDVESTEEFLLHQTLMTSGKTDCILNKDEETEEKVFS